MKPLQDGLYVVQTGPITAGFEVVGGQVASCAPVLRNRLSYWVKRAKRVEPPPPTRSHSIEG